MAERLEQRFLPGGFHEYLDQQPRKNFFRNDRRQENEAINTLKFQAFVLD